MNGFNKSYGMDLLQQIKLINNSIDSILNTYSSPDIGQLDYLSGLIQNRTELFSSLSHWRHTTEGSTFVIAHKDFWEQTISTMERDDRYRLEIIKERKESVGKILQERISKKNVLLYHQTGV